MMMPPRKCVDETVSVSTRSNKSKAVLLPAILWNIKLELAAQTKHLLLFIIIRPIIIITFIRHTPQILSITMIIA